MAKQKKQGQAPQADNNGIAVGEISIGGDVSGNIHIGHTTIYNAAEDDLPLSSDEIENGLTRFAQFLPERAPVLQDSFSSIAKKLRATLGADQNSLSPALKAQREDGVNRMKLMCMEVMDISFRAMCLGQNPPPYDSRPPFLGLFAFHPEDREFFFGRDALVQKLVTRIRAHPFLAVLGASGSGKSSLVMAGLIPALEAQMSYLTPSSAPLSQLLTAKESASAKTVFVIDQFEELFTHAAQHDATERRDFIHELLELTKTNRVVVTMRADFWGEVAIYSDLKQAMQEHQELIAPMNVDELHSAMEKQAAVVGLHFDPTLSESILAEVKGEPGAMPLLQHALWELWNRRHGLWIKAEEYQAFGGVKQAIASTAEEVYASCSDFERDRVRDIFLRLTRLDPDGSGEGRDMRRRVLIEELIPVNSDSSVTINLLDKLADARLIVKTDKDVEVAHEALIRHWSRLTEWLNEDRDNLRLREGVSESAREWENSNRDDSLLNHRGGRLELALAMSKLPRYQLNPIEQAYLNECLAVREKEKTSSMRRRRITFASVFAVLAIIMVILTGWSISSTKSANANATQISINSTQVSVANTAQAVAEVERKNAEQQAQIAQAGELDAFSESFRDKNFPLSMLLGIEAFQRFNTYQSRNVLLTNILLHPQLQAYITGYPDITSNVVYSPNGKILAWGSSDGAVNLWDTKARLSMGQLLAGHTSTINNVAFSPDGKILASRSDDNILILWNVKTNKPIGQPLATAGMSVQGGVGANIAFSPDSKTLAFERYDAHTTSMVTAVDSTVILWDVDTRQPIGQPLTKHLNFLSKIAFSPDGKILAWLGTDMDARGQYVILWDIETHLPIGQPIAAQLNTEMLIYSIAFSPDSKTLALGGGNESENGAVILWNVDTHKPIDPPLIGHVDLVSSLAFSPDGKTLTSGSIDNTIILWNLMTYKPIGQPLTSTDPVRALAFSPDGKTLISENINSTFILWDVEPHFPIGHLLPMEYTYYTTNSIAFSPDGKTLASSSSYSGINLWNTKPPQFISNLGYANIVFTFSPDGETLVTGSDNNTLSLWSVETLLPIGQPLAGHTSGVNSVAFSQDGKTLASGSDDNTVIIWDVETHQPIGQPLTGHTNDVNSVAFSPDGKTLASGSDDNTVILWDVETHQLIDQPLLGEERGGITRVVFTPDGKTLASMQDDCTIIFSETGTHKPIGQLAAPQTTDYDCSSIVFSPDGKTLASGARDAVILWDMETLQPIGQPLIGSVDSKVLSIAFSPDGKTLASGSNDNTVILWNLDPQIWIDKTCQHVTRNLTRAEWDQYIGDELPYQAVCPNLPIEALSTPVP